MEMALRGSALYNPFGVTCLLPPCAFMRCSNGKYENSFGGRFIDPNHNRLPTNNSYTRSSPDIFLKVLRQRLVHRLKIDRRLSQKNQQCLEIDIQLELNRCRKAAPVNRLLQILIRESINRCFQFIVQCLKPGLESGDTALQTRFPVVI